MRVCMLGYTFYEVDSRVQQYARALLERGDEVDFVGLGRRKQRTEEIVEGVRIFRLQEREFDEKGKLTYLFRLSQFLARSSVFLAWRHLHNRYDIIHVHSVPDFLVFSAFVPKLAGAKVILDIHDVVPEFYATKFNTPPGSFSFQALLLLEKLCAAYSDHVIIANDIWRQKLITRSLKPSKCTTFLNYPMYLSARQTRRQKADSKFIILFPGSLNYHQGVDIAVRAVALVKNSIPELEFHIYGDGRERENIIQLIQRLGLEKHVFLRPVVSHEEIISIMQNVDLGVDPKRTDGFANEALGGKIFEYMACGLPAIVSDTEVNKHYFNESVVQFCRGGDPEDLAKSILLLYRDKALTKGLIENASEFVHRYRWDIQKSIYLTLVNSLGVSSKKVRARKSAPIL
jgi:glycosyltransferase involved in cell wall biosynthesis